MHDPRANMKTILATLALTARRAYETAVNWTWLAGPNAYQPEAHYMRGPGPKWRAKHGIPARAFARQGQRRTSRTI